MCVHMYGCVGNEAQGLVHKNTRALPVSYSLSQCTFPYISSFSKNILNNSRTLVIFVFKYFSKVPMKDVNGEAFFKYHYFTWSNLGYVACPGDVWTLERENSEGKD